MITKEFEVDGGAYLVAKEALRDVLFMYFSMNNYKGFGNSLDLGAFNPYLFLKTKILEEGYFSKYEIDFLQKGSAIKILSMINDYLDENSLSVLPNSKEVLWNDLLEGDHFNHLPEANVAFISAFKNYQDFQENLNKVYLNYVVEHYKYLLLN